MTAITESLTSTHGRTGASGIELPTNSHTTESGASQI